ncbi:MAG: PEP-CTERM sorting domain-containing protein [Bryobacterales bacterium]|nr:PEP-CTERM sorting domain-containing protein [Bryobacterales bacterium]
MSNGLKCIPALLLLASTCLGVPIVAPPGCALGSLKDYIALGSKGCTLSPTPTAMKVSDFGFVTAGPLDESQIHVTPSAPRSSGSLRFSADFLAPTGKTFDYLTFFTIDPPPIIHGFETDMETFTPKNGGKASVTTELCIGAAFSNPAKDNSCKGTLLKLFVFYDSSGTIPIFQLKDRVNFDAAGIVGVRSLLSLDAKVGTSDIGAYANTSFVLPEPSTAILVLAGLGLLFLRRR